MKAAVIRGAHDLTYADLPDPVMTEGQVLLQVSHVGICGSDLSYYSKGAVGAYRVTEPLVPGHEVAGTVVQDDRPGGLAPGTRVTLHPATPGICPTGLEDRPNIWPQSRYLGSAMTVPHQQGAMSALFAANADRLRVLPDDLPLRRAALAEPLAVGLHAITLAGELDGRRVLVSGAGPIGVLLALACRIKGAAVTISDILPPAVDRALKLGIPSGIVVGGDAMPQESFDVVFEASGAAPALSPCLNAVVRGGLMVQVGILPAGDQPVDVAVLAMRELRYVGSFRFNDELDEAIAMLADHPAMEGVVTHEFAVEDVVAAFDCAADPAASLKVLVAL
ncbi:MAG: alcohol dehydrogenase catalytic domain-containing protein [Propionibacteriaceae bacterium]|nr:alcohol dehydrogenase catalytic domain-containing protein [Propionibacteriaceae bacterium]